MLTESAQHPQPPPPPPTGMENGNEQSDYPTPATPGSEIEHKYVPTMSTASTSNLINAAATASAIVNSHHPHSVSPIDRKPPIMPPTTLTHGSVCPIIFPFSS